MFLPSMNVTTPCTKAYSLTANALAAAIVISVGASSMVYVAEAMLLLFIPDFAAIAFTVVVWLIAIGVE